MRYANAYVAGVGVGLVLLATFVLTGHGLGAIGAYSRLVDPSHENWTLFELVGVAIGGALSAGLAGRLRVAIERGPSHDWRLPARVGLPWALGRRWRAGARVVLR
jgi:hypothetical protein